MWEALSTAQSQGCGFTCPGNRPEWVAWRICIFIVQSVLRHLHVDITECPYCDRVDITVHIVALVSMNSSGYAVWHYTVQQDFFSMLVCFFVPYPVSTEWGVSFVSTLHLRVCVCVCVLRGVGERETACTHWKKEMSDWTKHGHHFHRWRRIFSVDCDSLFIFRFVMDGHLLHLLAKVSFVEFYQQKSRWLGVARAERKLKGS